MQDQDGQDINNSYNFSVTLDLEITYLTFKILLMCFSLTLDHMMDEVLIHVFTFLSTEDLILRVHNVCRRWRELSTNPMVWRNKFFTPPISFSNENIENWMEKLRNIRHFKLEDGKDIETTIKHLLNNCSLINSIVVEGKSGPSWKTLLTILEKYPNITTLDTYVSNNIFHLDYAKILGSKFKDSSYYLKGGKAATEEMDTFDGFRLNNEIETGSQQSMKKILNTNIKNIKYLAIGSRISPVVANVIYQCSQLKKLFLFSDDDESDLIDLGKLTYLQELDTIQLCVSSKANIIIGKISYFGFRNLVKFEIYSLGTFSNFDVRIIWSICPNLQHVRLRTTNLLDEAFQGIGKCKFLKHLDLSFNFPGLYDACLQYVAQGCYNLEFLDMSYSCKAINYNLEILGKCSQLRYLWLRHQEVTTQNLESIPKLFPNLIELNLMDASPLPEKDVSKLKRIMPNLNILIGRDGPRGEEF